MTAELIRPEPKRDRYGRYLLPDPGNPKKEIPWTRATTFAKSISDTYGLGKWQIRQAVRGVAMRPDLLALAASAHADDKETLGRVAEQAQEAAASSSGSNLGTALHTFTERIDAGEKITVPEPWDRDVAAYVKALGDAGIRIVPEYIERIVVVNKYQVAGTLDRLVRMPDGRLVVADLKTGKDLSYSWGEIAVQLALYANADAMWDHETRTYVDMPENPLLDASTALVIHLPVGKGECTLYDVDILSGWCEATKLCADVRTWRKRKDLATKRGSVSTPSDPPQVPNPREPVDLILAAIAECTAVDQLAALWLCNPGRWTDTHTAAARKRKAALERSA